MVRNLQEFRIRGIKTNIPFLENVVRHEKFRNGEYDTSFIDTTPELFIFPVSKDRGTKNAHLYWNGNSKWISWALKRRKGQYFRSREFQKYLMIYHIKDGTKQILDKYGARWTCGVG